jgi:hypothetical protein
MSDTLTAKLAKIMGEVGYLQKEGRNTHQGYTYVTAEQVLRKVGAACSEAGICAASRTTLLEYGNRTKANGKAENYAVVKLTLTFSDGTGEVVVEGLGEGADAGDKAIYKANTGAIKYAMQSAFLISWGDDPEADSSTDQRASDNVVAKAPGSPPKAPKAAKATQVAPKAEVAKDSLLEAVRATTDPAAREALKESIRAIRGSDPELYQQCVKLTKEVWT